MNKGKALYILGIFIILLFTAGLLFMIKSMPSPVPLIPRRILFGPQDIQLVRISPDGEKLAYLAPKEGVMNIWVSNIDKRNTKLLTHEKNSKIRYLGWAHDSKNIIYIKDHQGDENWKIYILDIESGREKLLYGKKGVQALVLHSSYKTPEFMIIGVNERNKSYHDLYLLNIHTGHKKRILRNNEYTDFLFDDDNSIVLLKREGVEGITYYRNMGSDKVPFISVDHEDDDFTKFLTLDESGEWIYMIESLTGDKANFARVSLETREILPLLMGDKADISGALIDPVTKIPQAVSTEYLKKRYIPIAPEFKKILADIQEKTGKNIHMVSVSKDLNRWIVAVSESDAPVAYYFYDSDKKDLHFLYFGQDELKSFTLSKTHSVEITSRDGFLLPSYFTSPLSARPNCKGIPEHPVPMVVYVHGGPYSRSSFGYNPVHQWLSNRGYAVLDVNFRGSTGFGKKFLNAGNGEWGRKMHEDILDAIDWAIQKGIADPERIAILGGSYGGYEVLVSLTQNSDLFKCGIDIVGISNLITFMENRPPYWQPYDEYFKMRLGADFQTQEGQAFLDERSPLNFAANIRSPLLIAHGLHDPRVKKSESDQIVSILKENEIPVTYLLFPEEGHGFVDPRNKLAFFAGAEYFLARNLGGAFEDYGRDLLKAQFEVLEGSINDEHK